MIRRFAMTASTVALLALAGVALAELPEVGKPAPKFDLAATGIEKALPSKKDAKTLSLADLKGKNVVLFFYPKAMTKGCTVESCGFRDAAKAFADKNTVLLGISTDKLDAQEKFVEKEKLNFPLLADPEKKVTEAYGALGKTGLAARYTFVIDGEGVLRKTYTKVTPKGHPEEVLKFVEKELAGKK